ncbi:CxxC-x17-CxxC domain-containing protein, partial [Methanoregula sp.]
MYGSSNFGGRGPRDAGPREMTKVTCSDCGKECEVPFKPT